MMQAILKKADTIRIESIFLSLLNPFSLHSSSSTENRVFTRDAYISHGERINSLNLERQFLFNLCLPSFPSISSFTFSFSLSFSLSQMEKIGTDSKFSHNRYKTRVREENLNECIQLFFSSRSNHLLSPLNLVFLSFFPPDDD